MYCSKCGKQIKDDSKFCQFCGAQISSVVPPFVQPNKNIIPPPIPKPMVQQNTQQEYANTGSVQTYEYDQQFYSYDQQAYDYNQQGYTQLYEQQLPMNWYKFVIWVQLFLSAAVFAITGFLYVTGLRYGKNSIIYDWYPGARIVDILLGIVYLLMAPMAVFVRQQLVQFKKNSTFLLLGYYCLQIPVNIVYAFLYTLILGANCFNASFFGTIIGTGILVALSYVYFDKRKAYFNQ